MKVSLTRLVLPLLVFAACSEVTLADEIINYTFGNYSQSDILNDGTVGTHFDTLALTGLSGSTTIAPGASLVLPISFVLFTDGPSCAGGCASVATQTGSAVFDATINGSTQSLSVPFLACLSGGYSSCAGASDDTIQLFGSAPLTFTLADGSVLTLSSLDMAQLTGISGGAAGPNSGYLDATFSVATPEPGSLILLGAGLATFMRMKRRKIAVQA